MEEEDTGFFIALPSNTIHPSRINLTSHYFMPLPSKIKLEGIWEVALVEVTIPVSWYNVPDYGDSQRTVKVTRSEFLYNKLTQIVQQKSDRVVEEAIPYGNYVDIFALASAINDVLRKIDEYPTSNLNNYTICRRAPHIVVQPQNLQPKMYIAQGDTVCFSTSLARLLKMDSVEGSERRNGNLGKNYYPGYPLQNTTEYFRTYLGNIETVEIKAYGVPEINYSTNLFIYSNIVEKQLVGDIYVPLLRTLSCDHNFGRTLQDRFSKPYYKKVVKTEINEIEIKILDQQGENIRFQYGSVMLVLHFRKRKN